jgi:GTP-binding protein LepA
MSGIPAERTRNFCIVAHIDHGKSTLADRFLEQTHTLPPQAMREQVLDAMDLEREKGITIKSHPVAMRYAAADGQEYALNLIDTPGHVDFTYEVSRSLAACEGALLLVDATQGLQAQTLSNFYLALDAGLTIVPVVNKIDMPSARIEEAKLELAHLVGADPEEVLAVSARTGQGVEAVLEAVIARVPAPPSGREERPLRALIFDSQFDSFRGVVATVRVVDGRVAAGQAIQFVNTGKHYEVSEVGIFRLAMVPVGALSAGQVGYLVAGVKNVEDAQVGDTVAAGDEEHPEALAGYRPVQSMVFSGLYPVNTEDYEGLREALAKLKLNDAALLYQPETSVALGFGFRSGFLGLLHMEIVQERLEREYGLHLIATVPSVEYRVYLTNGTLLAVDSPAEMPSPSTVARIEEPVVAARIVVPSEYVGNIMKLAQERRGRYQRMDYLEEGRTRLEYRLPLAEIVVDFYDRLKSLSRGYASLDYDLAGYEPAEVVKMDLLLNGEPVDALSTIVHRDKAYDWGRTLAERLKKLIPRQMFPVAIQAAVGSKIIARETLGALRKNVTAKCYGGDITRKRKLLEKQKEGKRRMKQIGTVEVPQEAFLALLKVDR